MPHELGSREKLQARWVSEHALRTFLGCLVCTWWASSAGAHYVHMSRAEIPGSSHIFMRTEIAAIFAICDCDAHRGPQKSQRFPRQEKAMLHCDLRVRWKVASDLRFRAAISEPKAPSFCGISGDLAPSTRKSLAIAIVRFWCAKLSLMY